MGTDRQQRLSSQTITWIALSIAPAASSNCSWKYSTCFFISSTVGSLGSPGATASINSQHQQQETTARINSKKRQQETSQQADWDVFTLYRTATHGEIVAVNADRTIESMSLSHCASLSHCLCVSHCASRTGGAPVRIVVVNLVLCVRLIRLTRLAHVFPRCRSSNPKRHRRLAWFLSK